MPSVSRRSFEAAEKKKAKSGGFDHPHTEVFDTEPEGLDIFTEKQKNRCRVFATEYIKDFNGYGAALRMGYSKASAAPMSHALFHNPYTQLCIQEIISKAEEQALVTATGIIAGLLREANHFGVDGGSAARTQAWRALAKIKGMEVQTIKQESAVTVQGGVMALPFAASLAEWEAATVKAQEALKAQVRQ